MAELPVYTFLPWARRGLGTRVDQPDHLGATPAAGPADRATMTASVTLTSVAVPGAAALPAAGVSQTVSLVGPGDVAGLTPGTVLRASPVAGSVNATPGELAYVEFYDEDLPWRYTPARATDDHRLRPWLVLLVLTDDECTLTPVPGKVALLTVADTAPLPPETETWAWAHVQTTGDLGARTGTTAGDRLDAHVSAAPDLALSRLLCPRRLEPHTGYRAAVVPAFEAGRLAGLGTPPEAGAVPAQQPSWGQGQPRLFPVLHHWAFRTGALADFEVLARRPRAFRIEAAGFGTRNLDVSHPGAGVEVEADTSVALEGALAPVDFTGRVPFPTSPGTALADGLREVVDLAVDARDSGVPADEDPVVTPPAYARRHLGVERLSDAATSSATRWLAELNLDPRNRAAAGLGAEIVRQRDEEYLERAWAQVEDLDVVNQRLREADLAVTTSDRLYAKHLAGSGADRVLGLTAAAQSVLRASPSGDTTVRGEVDASRVPAAAQAPAFRRITRPARPLMRSLADAMTEAVTGPVPVTTTGPTTVAWRTGLLDRLNEDPVTAVSTAPPAADPLVGVDQTQVVSAVAAVAAQLPRGRDLLPVLAGEEVEGRRHDGTLAGASIDDVRTGIGTRLDGAFPASTPGTGPLRAETTALAADLTSITIGTGDAPTVLGLKPTTFAQQYGRTVDGKSHLGVVIAPADATTGLTVLASTAGVDAAAEFADAFADFEALARSRPAPGPADPLGSPTAMSALVLAQMRPAVALPARLATVLSGVDDPSAGLATTQRLQPVLDHPTFDDALFEPLRQLSQDYVIPNIANLPAESIALMVPNARFIESLLAGVNTEFARELLWNEYPTDQRGTYFARFFDAADADGARPPDIPALPGWNQPLGSNAPQLSGLLVLVVRAELLVKFPDTVVFAQHGHYVGNGTGRHRTLDPVGEVRYPVVRGRLDPDIALFGFELTPAEAAGTTTDAGFFFCFMERPGQLRFGLDLDEDPTTPAPALAGWDDLNWKHLQPVAGQPAPQVLVSANAALAPTTSGLPAWGETSAHQASILCQNPVWLARHATDMLPVDADGPGDGRVER